MNTGKCSKACDYLREMNVSEQLADAIRVEPEHIKYLTYQAVKDFGLTTWDPVYKEMMDVAEAKKFGITRQEFMVRRSRALGSVAVTLVSGWIAVSA
jgi:hypothetical protein